MKLKNKKTGKIGYLYEHSLMQDIIIVYDVKGIVGKYKLISELCEEWEDYEEPKRHWIIDTMNDRVEDFDVPMTFNEAIGNYFETKEEAEKAVEKLKAVKRLKDKGFRFKGCDDYHIDYEFTGRCVWTDETEKDLDLLFGGEE